VHIPITDRDEIAPSSSPFAPTDENFLTYPPPRRDRHPRYIQRNCQLQEGRRRIGEESSALTFRCHRRSWRSLRRQACAGVRRPHEAKQRAASFLAEAARAAVLAAVLSPRDLSTRGVAAVWIRGGNREEESQAALPPFTFIDLDPEVRSASRRHDNKLQQTPSFY
jgi:hypothetical protein